MFPCRANEKKFASWSMHSLTVANCCRNSLAASRFLCRLRSIAIEIWVSALSGSRTSQSAVQKASNASRFMSFGSIASTSRARAFASWFFPLATKFSRVALISRAKGRCNEPAASRRATMDKHSCRSSECHLASSILNSCIGRKPWISADNERKARQDFAMSSDARHSARICKHILRTGPTVE